MAAFVETLRTGAWLTRERIRLIALAALFASAVGLSFILATSNGVNDYQGRPLGTDFSNVYAAGTYVLDGNATAPFSPPAQFAREKQIFGENTQFYGWHYPPFFLFVAALLALMPYALALAVWQGVTFAFYLFSISRIVPSSPGARRDSLWWLLALAFPAVFVNIGHGHNGFLTAALIGLALVHLPMRPILAGVLFGLLAYKPQFGLLIPLVLVAGGYWRAFAAAAATVIALAAITTLVFGIDIWTAFLASTEFTRTVVLERGDTGWHKIQSVFSWARMWGGTIPLAYAVQGMTTLLVATALGWLWRSEANFSLKAAALVIGTILATPYSLDYDFVILAPAIAFLASDGLKREFAPWEKSAIALLWFMPLVARAIAQRTFVPLGVLAMLILFILILRRAMKDLGFRVRSMTKRPT
jgi:hypothetical protein